MICKVLHHNIDTGSASPVRQPVRRLSLPAKEEVKKLLAEMLQKNVISPSTSPWASPIVLVQKKDGSTRFCVDYRKVNSLTRKDAYPIPKIDETLDTLAGAKLFSTLDLRSGYCQVQVNPEHRPFAHRKVSLNSMLCPSGCAMHLPPFRD